MNKNLLKGDIIADKNFIINLRIGTIAFVALFICFSAVAKAENMIDTTSMVEQVHPLNEVIITGARNETDLRKLPLTVTVVTNQMIKEQHQQSILPILNEQIPGLFITSRSVMGYGVAQGASGTISLRGIGGQPTTGVLVLIDGIPQNMGIMGHPIADIYQSMLAERIEVIRGPASVLYGSNAMGGVINVVTPKLEKDSTITRLRAGYGSFNTFETGFFNRHQKGKFSSKITAIYNRTDGHRKNMEFDQYSVSTKLGYQINKVWKVFGDFNLTHFNASNPGTIQNPINDNDSHITRGMSTLSIQNNHHHLSGALKLYYNCGKHEIDNGYKATEQPQAFHFNSKDLIAGITWYQTIKLRTYTNVTIGVDYLQFGGRAWNQFIETDQQVEITDQKEREIAGYADVRQTIYEIISFDAGIRYDYHTKSGKQWVPQAGVSAHFNNALELKAIVSKGFRNPTIKDLYLFGPKNPDLLPESVMNYELSLQQKLLKNSLSYKINLFYLKGSNIIQTVFTDGRPLNMNTGKIENHGIETAVNYAINDSWSMTSNYSWLHMKNPVIGSPEHKLFLGVNYSTKNYKFSSNLQYVNGLYTSIALQKKETYLLWNIRGSYSLNRNLSLFAKAENLLGQKYEVNMGYPMPKTTVNGGINFNF